MSRRVLDPEGALAHRATRLDPIGPLVDGERRLDLEALVLGPGTRDLRLGGANALRHAVQERGGLPPAATHGALVGALQGVRVVVLDGLAGLPVWVQDVGPWDGTDPVVPVVGHAVLGPDHPVTVADGAPQQAVVAAVGERVRRLAGQGRGPLLVLGDARHALAAVTGARGAGRRVVVTAGTLRGATELAELGAEVVVDQGATPAARRDRLAERLGTRRDGARTLVLGPTPPSAADDDGAAAALLVDRAGTITAVVEVVGGVRTDDVAGGSGATVVRRDGSGGGMTWH
jgi:hypothetical protein